MHSFYISAAHKSSGKTTISIALSNIFSKNYATQTFKKGPDYIDPIWLGFASGNPCYNLDFYNMSNAEIKELYTQKLQKINIIEGNKGLFDGMATAGGDSNADLAKLLNIPVILVIDCIGITRGIAPLLQGYNNFDDTNIAGVILNKVGGVRHEKKLRAAIKEYTDLEVFGVIHKHKDLIIDERHLGLKPATEDTLALQTIAKINTIVQDSLDITKLLDVTLSTSPTHKIRTCEKNINNNLTVAIAQDEAFGFYYADDLQKFIELGATIVYFNSFTDTKLPPCDGLFIGGGFPETNVEKLAQNNSLMQDIKSKIEQGLPTYAECGGMMYLTKSIDGFATVGVLDADTITTKKPIGRGYMQIQTQNHPWGINGEFKTHEFHYSKLTNLKEQNFAFKVKRGVGITGKYDGIIKYNLLATYTHQRAVGGNNWVADFISFINKYNNAQQ
jgi:cobyrinic acid a,c-diamide synthase